MSNQPPPMDEKLAESIIVICEALKAMNKNPKMQKVLVALIMGSKGGSTLKKKEVEFVVEKIYDLSKEYHVEEILKMRDLRL